MGSELHSPWLSLVGIGDDGLAGLGARAREVISEAEIFVGGERHLSFLPEDARLRIRWAAPLDDIVEKIHGHRGKKVCVLATGDPFFFGIGDKLAGRIPIGEMKIFPAASSLSLTLSKLGWSFADVKVVSLHGRPLQNLIPHLISKAKLVILSGNRGTPIEVAKLLDEKGFGESELHVFSHLGGSRESAVTMTAAKLAAASDESDIEDLNLVAAEVAPAKVKSPPHLLPGLADDDFRHDGQITKREVRILTLSALGPTPGDLLWDVGAGAGSVSIEWLRADPSLEAIAIEHREDRLENIRKNMDSFGVLRLQAVQGRAPDCLADLPAPDAIFVGGGLSVPGVLETCWERLSPGGRLVANAVTLEGETALMSFGKKYGGGLTRVQVGRAAPAGRFEVWRPITPVTQFRAVKGSSSGSAPA